MADFRGTLVRILSYIVIITPVMRFARLIMVVVLASAMHFSFAQTSQEEPNLAQDLSKSITVFPNPAPEYVHIRFEKFHADKVKLTLHNIIGNEMETESEVVNEHEVRVKVKDLAAGYYLIAVKCDEAKFRGIYKFSKR